MTFRYKPLNVKGCSSYTFGWYIIYNIWGILTGFLIPWPESLTQTSWRRSDIGSQLQRLQSTVSWPHVPGGRSESTHSHQGWPEWELFTGWRTASRALEELVVLVFFSCPFKAVWAPASGDGVTHRRVALPSSLSSLGVPSENYTQMCPQSFPRWP